MTEFTDERPPVSAAELAAAEAELADLGQRIPPSYKAFLAERDGGRPVLDFFEYEKDNERDEDAVDVFLGLRDVPPPAMNLVRTAGLLNGRILEGVLPIADDPYGNVICIDCRDGRDGPVLLWDHEYESEPPDEANLYLIAPNLQMFLEGLHENPNPLPPPEPKPKGLKRLFGRG
jgi:SMI1 / KNR4 family (SUKH-1)